jgi:hypothetical protein
MGRITDNTRTSLLSSFVAFYTDNGTLQVSHKIVHPIFLSTVHHSVESLYVLMVRSQE